MAITASGQADSGRIRFAGSYLAHSVRIRIGCFFSFSFFPAPEVAQIIIIGSESDPFLYIWSGSDLVLDGHVSLCVA